MHIQKSDPGASSSSSINAISHHTVSKQVFAEFIARSVSIRSCTYYRFVTQIITVRINIHVKEKISKLHQIHNQSKLKEIVFRNASNHDGNIPILSVRSVGKICLLSPTMDAFLIKTEGNACGIDARVSNEVLYRKRQLINRENKVIVEMCGYLICACMLAGLIA